MHKLTFWPQSESKPPVDVIHLTFPGPHPELSEPTESLALPVPSPMLLSNPSPSDKLQATTAKIAILFMKALALSLLSHLPPSHPQAILCMGVMISLFFLCFSPISLFRSVPLLLLHFIPPPAHNPLIFPYFINCCCTSHFSAPLC